MTTGNNTSRALRNRRRTVAGIAVIGALALLATGCTSSQEDVTDPSRILQTVDTGMSSGGSITSVADTTISVGASNESSSRTTDHDPAKVADDLPIRVSTQYRTAKKTGTDLDDLEGYSGKVQIDLTVENLTVTSRELRYDVAGESRQSSALVGAPFSIAASTVLTGVSPSRIVTDSSDDGATTNGVVSADGKGDAVVQWATLLAPPTSGASSTLHLVANVQDMRVPSFDLAAQPGISTDLSSDGVLASAFDAGNDSELALQRRTIDLIADVNGVLARAGGTITEVRTNLQTTSETLGVSTAERLRDSSTSLASTMQGLTGQLSSLNGDLGATVTGTQSTVLTQLRTTVASLDSLLGDTSATAPAVSLDGAGCAAVPQAAAQSTSVYGNLLRVSAQLDGYASASEDCKQQVSAQLASSVGPEQPDATTCAVPENAASLTCALFASSVSVNASLVGLVATGQELAAKLDPNLADDAITTSTALEDQLADIATQVDGLDADGSASVQAALQQLDDAVRTASQGLQTTADQVSAVNADAQQARTIVGNTDDVVSGTMQAQNSAVANQLCLLAATQQLDAADADRLRGYLTATPCLGAPDGTTLAPGLGFSTPMDQRLADQADRWDAVVAATDVRSDTGIGGALGTLRNDLGAVQTAASDVRTALRQDDSTVGGKVQALRDAVTDATTSSDRIGAALVAVRDQQQTLQQAVSDAFDQASAESAKDVQAIIDGQVRNVSETAGASNEAVLDAFDQSIAGLRSTSADVKAGSKGTIDTQRRTLEQQTSGLAAAVDAQTAQSLQQIATSTSASTRDVEGASTLLTGDLNRVMLDLGDRKVNGSGILGAMATSAAKADSADYQLALASQNASGYANIRAEDVAGILLQQAQVKASLTAATDLPAFHRKVPSGATSTTLYTFRIGGRA